MNLDESRAILLAGGIIAPDAAIPQEPPSDPVQARRYVHDAEPERIVVKLVPENLAAALDLEMEAQGFRLDAQGEIVGRRLRRAVGFPALPIIAFPHLAKHALAVHKRFKKAARLAKSKPGHARDEFEAIAAELGASVPAFLPSFYEEAGRAFLAAESSKYAATMVEKARAAERTHALDVDEDVRREVLLEFALRGALGAATIAQWARDLATQHDAAKAHEHFELLTVRVIRGGVPPRGDNVKDLRRLGAAAGIAADDVDRRLLEAIGPSPALGKANHEFWKLMQKALEQLAREHEKWRHGLLRLSVRPSDRNSASVDIWLRILEDTGADRILTTDDPSFAPGARARWLAAVLRMIEGEWGTRNRSYTRFNRLLKRMAPQLRSEGVPFNPRDRLDRFVLDAADLALECSVPIDRSSLRFNFSTIEEHGSTGDDPRPLMHVARDEEIAGAFTESYVESYRPSWSAQALESPGLVELLAMAAQRLADRCNTGGVFDAEDAWTKIRTHVPNEVFRRSAAAREALASIDVGAAFLRHLRAGFVEEITWPDLEAAITDLGPVVEAHGSFPHAVVTDCHRAIAVGPEGRSIDLALGLPPNVKEIDRLRFIQGRLWIRWQDKDSEKFKGLVGEAPLPGDWTYGAKVNGRSWILDDGRLVNLGPAHSAGEDPDACSDLLLTDGASVWMSEWNHKVGARLRDYDPFTGRVGRYSEPRFLAEFRDDNTELDLRGCRLGTLPPSMGADGLIPVVDGRFGTRVRRRRATTTRQTFEVEDISGRMLSIATRHVPFHLLSWPGDESIRVALQQGNTARDAQLLCDASGLTMVELRLQTKPRGSGCRVVYPIEFWHFYRPRDLAASRWLRHVDPQVATKLFAEAHRAHLEGTPVLDAVSARLRVVRPGLDRIIAAGIAHLAELAAKVSVELDVFRAASGATEAADSSAPRESSARGFDEAAFVEATWGLLCSERKSSSSGAAANEMRVIHDWFTRRGKDLDMRRLETRVRATMHSQIRWELAITTPAGVLARAASATIDAAGVSALLDFLRVREDMGWDALDGHLRVYRGSMTKTEVHRLAGEGMVLSSSESSTRERGAFLLSSDRRDRFIRFEEDWSKGAIVTILEHSPSGEFEELEGFACEEYTLTAKEEELRKYDIAELRSRVLAGDRLIVGSEAAALFSRLTRRSIVESAIIVSGFLKNTYGNLPYISEVAKAMGCKRGDVTRVARELHSVSALERFAVLAIACPGVDESMERFSNPLAGGEDSTIHRMAAIWNIMYPPPPEFDVALATELDRDVRHLYLRSSGFLQIVAARETAPQFSRNRKSSVDGDKNTGSDEAEGFTATILKAVVVHAALLFGRQAVGDKTRATMPDVVRLAAEQLGLDRCTLPVGTFYYEHSPDRSESPIQQAVAILGARPSSSGDGSFERDGFVIAPGRYHNVIFSVRTAASTPESVEAMIASIQQLFHSPSISETLQHWRVIRDRRFLDMMARIEKSPVPVGRFECQPDLSAPEVVTACREGTGLTQDGAILYLQTLVLYSSSQAEVCRWNEWTKGRYGKAASELIEKEFVVEAKRARAGRTIFLPGGWEPYTTPFPPIETWKLGFHGIARSSKTRPWHPLGILAPTEPYHVSFARAWREVSEGRGPRYEEPGT